MSSTLPPFSLPQPITFFLPATSTRIVFHEAGSCAALHTPLPSCSSSLSQDFLYFFKMTSCASFIKSNKTRQDDIFHMHRRGDTVAKQVKETNKTKKKRRSKRKRFGCPSPLVSPTYEPSNSHNGPSLPRPSSSCSIRAAGGNSAGGVGRPHLPHSPACVSLDPPLSLAFVRLSPSSPLPPSLYAR
jgi:hypothetical protein